MSVIYDTWLLGRTSSGSLTHAVMSTIVEGFYWKGRETFTTHAMCWAGGSNVVHQSSQPYSPTARRDMCKPCQWMWSEEFGEPVPGFERNCRECGETKGSNHFRADARTSTGQSPQCTECWRKAHFALRHGRGSK